MATECASITINPRKVVRVLRKFDLGGDLAVTVGEDVKPSSLLGYNSAEELLHYLRVEVDDSRPLAKMLKEVGAEVRRGEPVAYYMFMFGLGYREYISPVNGTLISFDERNGLIAIREHRTPLYAGVEGRVESVIPGYGAVIATEGGLIEGTAGWGDAAWGELMLLARDSQETVEAQDIGPGVRGKIAYVGAYAEGKLLEACYRHGALGVLAGGVDQLAADAFSAFAAEMTFEEYATRYYSGGEAGAAVPDGADSVPMPVIALDGAGRVGVCGPAHSLLLEAVGQTIFIDASGQTLACAGRPAVVVGGSTPSRTAPGVPAVAGMPLASPGAKVRIIGGPHGGQLATMVAEMPEVQLPTGLHVPGALVRTTDGAGEEFGVPIANLEIVEMKA